MPAVKAELIQQEKGYGDIPPGGVSRKSLEFPSQPLGVDLPAQGGGVEGLEARGAKNATACPTRHGRVIKKGQEGGGLAWAPLGILTYPQMPRPWPSTGSLATGARIAIRLPSSPTVIIARRLRRTWT